MKTRLLLNLVLLCVVGALILVVVFEPGKDKSPANPLSAVDESRVDAVSLQGSETIEFERRNGHWWIKAPFVAPANEIRVRQLIDITRAESDARYPLRQEELAKFELDKPKAILSLGGTTLRFGGSDPIDMRRYVQIGDTLHLVRDDFSQHLTARATDYVDKKLLPEDAKIDSITAPNFKAVLGADGKWTIEPASPEGSAAAASLLNAWQSARAIDVGRASPGTTGEPLRIGLTDGSAITFAIVKREPELELVRPDWGLRYEIVGDIAKQLLNIRVADEDRHPAEAPSPAPEDMETVESVDETEDSAEMPDQDLGIEDAPDHRDAADDDEDME